MLLDQFLYYLFSAFVKIVLFLLKDPINAFCLVFLFFNTFGYFLILLLAKMFQGQQRSKNRTSIEGEVGVNPSELPMVTVIIPAHNEEEVIEKKVKNTFTLDYPKDLLEVIVVDDGSTDKTSSILEELQRSAFPDLKIIRQPARGKSAAENMGLQNSNGELIVFSDADVPLNTEALRFLVEDFRDPKVGGVTCTIQADKKYVQSLNLDLGLYARRLENDIDSIFGMSGPFVSFRRAIVPKVDEGIFSSDTDTGVTVRKRGYRVVYDSRIVSYVDQWVESRPKTVGGELRKLKHISFGSIHLFIRHKNVLFRKRYGLFGFIIAPRYLFFSVFAPVLFVLLSVNSIVKLIMNNLLMPVLVLIVGFLLVTFLLRKMVAESFISKTFYLVFMYMIGFYAQFLYYLLFIFRSSQRRGMWRRH